MKIVIDHTGTAMTMHYDEYIEILKDIGIVKTDRASHVEPEGEGWTVRAAHNPELAIRAQLSVSTKGDIAIFPTRSEAIAAEIEHFWELVPHN